jgi:hypothetical protein
MLFYDRWVGEIMKRSWYIVFACAMLFGCVRNTARSFSDAGPYPGTKLTVFLSEPVVHRGEQSSIVFQLRNTTDTIVRIPIDEWGNYEVQPDLDVTREASLGCVYGRLDPMPEWYYRQLKPGESMSNTFHILTQQLLNPSGMPAYPPKIFHVNLPNPGLHKIGISRGRQRIAVLELKIVEP